MIELNVNDIIERLQNLAAYSPRLAERTDHERHLPENPAEWFAASIAKAFDRVENSTEADRGAAFDELEDLLIKSYEYYISRLAAAGTPWVFKFPRAYKAVTHPAVHTLQ